MSRLSSALYAYGQITGLASAIFMLYVFYSEAILGHGVLYYEPNLLLATGELLMVGVGLIVLIGTLMLFLRQGTDKAGEPYGYPKSDRSYA